MAKQGTAPGPDNFDFSLVTSFPGYISSTDPTLIKPGYLVQGSVNTYRKTSGSVANRPGRKLYDVGTDATVAGIKSAFVWHTSLATTLPLRCVNGKLQVESNVTGSRVWYDLLTSLTLTRFVFDSWWNDTDKKDTLIMVNGGTNVFDWSGGFALFVSGIASTSITINGSSSSAGFASAGTVTINGNDYSYTGISGSTLTGVTGDPSGEPANSVVMQKINTTANSSLTSGPTAASFTDDFIKVVGNQLYLGSYTSRLVYISKNTSFKDFSQSTPRLTGEGNVLTLDDTGRGIGVRQGVAHIFGGSDALYIVSFSQITVNTVLSEQVKIDKIKLGDLASANAHEFIDSLSDNLIYLDQANQVRSFGTFRNLATDRPAMLSQEVMDELFLTDFSGGQLKVISDRHGDNIYITAPLSAYVYWYQERTSINALGNIVSDRLWQPPQLWGVSRIDSIANSTGLQQQTVGFSSANPQMYYLWDTSQFYDDIPSGQTAYNSIALFAYQNGGRRQGKIAFEKTYVEGYTTQGTNLSLGVYFDYQGDQGIIAPVISNPDSRFTDQMIFTGVTPPSLGDASLGDNPLGDGLNTALDDQYSLPKFRVIVGTTIVDCFEFAPMIFSQTAGDRWEILTLGMNIHLSISSGIEIVK